MRVPRLSFGVNVAFTRVAAVDIAVIHLLAGRNLNIGIAPDDAVKQGGVNYVRSQSDTVITIKGNSIVSQWRYILSVCRNVYTILIVGLPITEAIPIFVAGLTALFVMGGFGLYAKEPPPEKSA